MPFLQRLRQTTYWEELTDAPNLDDLEEYVVADIHPHDQRQRNVVFLLESPHTDEILRKYPLAGRSGTNVTNVLGEALHVRADERTWPLGKVLAIHPREVERTLAPRLMRVGIMEVSELPMQLSPYSCDHKRRFEATLLKHLGTIREGPASDNSGHANPHVPVRRDERCKAVQQALIKDLRCRIARMGGRAYFVPCGRVARAFLHAADSSCDHFQGLVPHPSSSDWKTNALDEMVAAVRCHLEATD